MRFKTSILAVGVLAFSTLTSIVPATAVALDGVGVSTNGLQFFYDVNNPAGIDVNTLKDLSGNNRDAAVTQVSSQPVKSTSNGGHLSFNGSGGYATVYNWKLNGSKIDSPNKNSIVFRNEKNEEGESTIGISLSNNTLLQKALGSFKLIFGKNNDTQF